MAKKRQKYDKGIRLKPTDEALEAEGELSVGSSDPKLKARLDGADRDIVTEDQVQELENKTIDATDASGTNEVLTDAHDATYDDTLTTTNPVGGTPLKSLGTNVQSALDSVKVALDDQNEADEIGYDPSSNPETFATNVQTALDDTGIASQAAQDTADTHINNATGAHASSAISHTAIANLDSDNVQDALQELQEDIDTRATSGELAAHINETTDAHDASAVSVITQNNIASDNVQDALEELQGEITANAGSTQTHINNSTGAHAGSAISVVPTGNLSSDNVQEALEELQTDVDNAVDSAQLTAHTTATSAHGTTSAIVGVDDNQTLKNKTIDGALEYSSVVKSASKADIQPDPTTTGSDATLFYTNILASHLPIMRLENASLASVAMLGNPEQGKEVTIMNATGNDISIRNDIGATAANRILTGTKADIVLKDEASIVVKYDSVETRWMVIGGVGAEGGGDTDVDVMFVDNFDRTTIADYEVTNAATITESASEVINGTKSLKLDHTAAVSAKRTIDVPNKFRGRQVVMELDINSNATSGNITATVVDETNVVTLVNADSVEPFNGTGSEKRRFWFEIPETCASLSYEFDGLIEASAITIIDDIQIEKVFQQSTTTTTDELLKENEFSARIANNGTATITSQNSPFIQSVNRTGVGVVDVVFVPGFFTVAPTVQADTEFHTIQRKASVTGITTTGCTVTYATTNAGAVSDNDFNLVVQRQGSDYDANLVRRVETKDTFSEIVVEQDRDISEINEFSCNIDVNGNLISSNVDFIQSVTRITTGQYEIVYNVGVFSVEPSVVPSVNGSGGTSNTWCSYFDSTTSGVKINLDFDGGSGGTNRDIRVHISRQGSDVYNKTLTRVKTNPNQKVKIPSSEMRLEGSSSRGTGSETFIVNFNSLVKSIGSDLLLDNSNGTKITCKKDGLLSVSASVACGVTYSSFITKNQNIRTTYPVASEVMTAISGSTGFANNLSGTFKVKAGDVIRVASDAVTNGNFTNQLELYFQEQEIQVGVSNILPKFTDSDSVLVAYGYNGDGSSFTMIPRLSTIEINQDNGDFVYTDTATEGNAVTIITEGLYHVGFYGIASAAAALGLGVSVNGDGTTAIGILPETQRYYYDVSPASAGFAVSGGGPIYLYPNDVVRLHSDSDAMSSCRFAISKVGKPNITSVDVTPFVTDYPMLKVEEYTDVGTAPAVNNPLVSNGATIQRDTTGTLLSNSNGEFTCLKNNTSVSMTVSWYSSSGTASAYIYVDRGNGYQNMGGANASNTTYNEGTAWSGVLNKGDKIKAQKSTGSFGLTSVSLNAIGHTPEIVTESESNASDWTEYAPVISGFGTPANVKVFYKQSGQDVEIKGAFQAGSPTATLASISLPSGLQYDSNFHSYSGGNDIIGVWGRSGNATAHGGVTLINVANGNIELSDDSTWSGTASQTLSSSTGSSIVGVSEYISFTAKIPIQGWSSESKYLVNITKKEYRLGSETKTNDTWIDGKPIYRKVISGNFANNALLISGADTIVQHGGTYVISATEVFTFGDEIGGSFCMPRLNPTTNNIELLTSATTDIVAWIEYTKV
jgi:hypothetical protein